MMVIVELQETLAVQLVLLLVETYKLLVKTVFFSGNETSKIHYIL